MNKDEKKRLSAVLRATEYLFLENIGLKLVLDHRAVANWQKLLDHLLSDKEMLAGVRLKFSDFYEKSTAHQILRQPLRVSWVDFLDRRSRINHDECNDSITMSAIFRQLSAFAPRSSFSFPELSRPIQII